MPQCMASLVDGGWNVPAGYPTVDTTGLDFTSACVDGNGNPTTCSDAGTIAEVSIVENMTADQIYNYWLSEGAIHFAVGWLPGNR